jgi:DNA-binding MarR family transcriptional regulator
MAPRTKAVDAVSPEAVDTRFLRTLVGYNARRAALVIIDSFVREMAVHGFRPVDFSVMSVIKDNPGVTSRQLCAELNIQPPNLVGMVQTLEKRGLIERQAHPSDKRATGLHPTPAGLELMHGAERTATELETRMCAKLDLKQRTQLLKLLQAVYD